jgi:hypothetical protein
MHQEGGGGETVIVVVEMVGSGRILPELGDQPETGFKHWLDEVLEIRPPRLDVFPPNLRRNDGTR